MRATADGMLDDLVILHASRTFPELSPNATADEAVNTLRGQELNTPIPYLYVVDAERRLHGVVPMSRLLTAAGNTNVTDLFTMPLITVPLESSVREAAAISMRLQLLAIPVVTRLGRMHGIIAFSMFWPDASKAVARPTREDLLATIGVSLAVDIAERFRTRWFSLLWTVGGGVFTALLIQAHVNLLPHTTTLFLFLPVTLALSERAGMQAAVSALHPLPKAQPMHWSVTAALRKELPVSIPLAMLSGALLVVLSAAWFNQWRLALTIGCAVGGSMTVAAALGTAVSRLAQRYGVLSEGWAGPLVLAAADVIGVMLYIIAASWFR